IHDYSSRQDVVSTVPIYTDDVGCVGGPSVFQPCQTQCTASSLNPVQEIRCAVGILEQNPSRNMIITKPGVYYIGLDNLLITTPCLITGTNQGDALIRGGTSLQHDNQYLSKIQSEIVDEEEIRESIKLESLNDDPLMMNSPNNNKSLITKQPKLGQNMPNPFSDITSIPCYIPENSYEASIRIYGNIGQLLKIIPVSHFGEGIVDLMTLYMSNGYYTYTLLVDGKIIDTKKMSLIR
ncbi:MAG: hypothetical protein AB8G22_18495, partial [Saprospiraceae bacterium]